METIQKPEGFKEQKLHVIPEYRLKELSQFELTKHLYISDIGVFPRAQFHYRDRPEGCDAHIFIYCTEGEGWIQIGEQKLLHITSRHLAVISAGTPHRYGASPDSPWTIYWFHLQGDHAAPIIEMYHLDAEPISLPLVTSSMFLEHFDHCFDLLSNKTHSMPGQVHASHLIRQLISSIGMSAAGSAQDKKRESYMDSAIRYMNTHLDDAIKLSDIAAQTGLSKQHLIYLFNKETGFPPVEYFLRMKMQKAGQMLDLTDFSIKEIANAIGISDAYYFSRLFKKMIGVSPSEYRRIPKG